jgi:predicted nucleotidyltransferase
MLSKEVLRTLAKSGRIDLIRTLKAYPDRDFTVNELARTARVPTMTAWRAVKELKRAGLVKTRKVGNATSVKITDDRERLRTLRMIPETDPQRDAALDFASRLGESPWLRECRLFGSIGRGEHSPGEEVDVAVVYDDQAVNEPEAKEAASALAKSVMAETNVTIVPFTIALKEMGRKGGLASELRDKEVIWKA